MITRLNTTMLYRLLVPLSAALLAAGAMVALLAPQAAHASVWCVNTTGAGGCFTSIQAAINAANHDDTINIAPGVYTESVTLNKAVNLSGSGALSTIVQALPNQRALTVTGAITPGTQIFGLTFRGGQLAGSSCPASCGGGVLLTGGALPHLISDSVQANSAYKGGGLYADSAGTLFLEYISVLSNTTTSDGGGINTTSGITLFLNGAHIQNNRSTAGFGFGGGILSDGKLLLEFSDIVSNSVTGPGGGAYATGDVQASASLFQSNTSGDQGGGLRANANLVAQSTSFISNTAQQGGGAHIAGDVTVISGTFRNNSASADDGGGLYGQQAAFITSTSFVSNSAAARGGGALLVGAAQIQTGTFQSNLGQLAGGGLFVSGTLTLSGTQFISNSTNYFPSQPGGAGAYVFLAARITGARFVANASEGQGGGLYANGPLALAATDFLSNTSRREGGGVYVAGSATLTGGQFLNNRNFNYDGGGLYANNSLVVSGTQFINNHAPDRGGALYTQGGLKAVNTNFTGNTAEFVGAVYAGDAELSGGSFVNNTALVGGAGGLQALGNLMIAGTQFISNSASLLGSGALAHYFGNARIVNALFARNAGVSGALGLYSPGSVVIIHTTIADRGLNPHPAIGLFTGTLVLTNTVIVSYSAGISLTSAFLRADHALFFGNGMDVDGSGAYTVILNAPVHGNPLFIAPALDNYHLSPASPAIDAGIDAGVTTDFDGEPRPLGAGFDIGFDEVNVRKVWLPLIRR